MDEREKVLVRYMGINPFCLNCTLFVELAQRGGCQGCQVTPIVRNFEVLRASPARDKSIIWTNSIR